MRQFRSDEVLLRVSEYGDLLAPLLEGGPEVPASGTAHTSRRSSHSPRRRTS